MKKEIVGVLFVLLLLPCIAGARPVFYHVYACGCPDGSLCKDYGFIDDGTGLSYLMHLGCDGSICIYPLYGPFQPKVGATPPYWTAPANWPTMMASALLDTVPGAYVGLWVTTETGDTLRFRNPADAVERGQYLAMWQAEQGAGMMIVDDGTPETRRRLNDATDDFLASSRRGANTADQQMTQALVHRYFITRFGERFPSGRAELQELANIAAQLATTRQPIVVRQSPTPGNGHMMTVIPIAPELSGPAEIRDANGKIVWRGDVRGETTIAMNDVPTGMYFLSAENAKAVVINIVR